MGETLLVDTGAWLALFDRHDEHHQTILDVADLIDEAHLIVPWPLLYETPRTRLVRRREWVSRLDERLRRPSVTFVDDAEYRATAYALTVEIATRRGRDLSMIDTLCRLLIEDVNVRVGNLLTTNRKDFLDVCTARGVTMWP